MNIVFLSQEYPLWSPGGVGTFLQTFGRALILDNHKVTILGVGVEEKEIHMEDKEVQLIRLPKSKGILPGFIQNGIQLNKKLKEIHKVQQIDIIESTELGLALLSNKHKARKVIRLHGGHHFFAEAEKRGINWRKGFLEKRSFTKADGFIAVSNYVKSHTEKYLSYHYKPIEIINHPLDDPIEVSNILIKKNHILFAGTVCEKKGARQLIEAFKIVRGKYPEMILDIFGRDWFYPDGSSYIKILKNNYDRSYFENVLFHGTITRAELNVRYAEASFCVFPSHMETQGLVSLEAMLLKKPVISSKYGPGPETISHMKTGLLCDVYNPHDIAKKMIWCIENPIEANQLGINAEKKVRVIYNKNTILEKNIAFYNKLILNKI